jgi:hypothetical protein
VLVDEAPLVAAGGLLRAFHGDELVVGDGHRDGVEADELADGVGHGQVPDVGRRAEVLQLVVDEVDGVLVLQRVQRLQGSGHGDVLERMADALGACGQRKENCYCDNNGSVHNEYH